MEKYTDKEIVAELFKRLGVEVGEEWLLERGSSPKVSGYAGFYTVFTFKDNDLIEVGAYE